MEEPKTIEKENIDSFLKSGPKIPLTEKPMFRLAWSDSEYELRTGTYRSFTSTGILIREETKTEYVLKYNWLKERYILEQWFPPSLSATEELPESNKGSFEPIYVFEDAEGKALPLKLQVIEFIVKKCLEPQRSSQYLKSVIDERLTANTKRLDDRDWDLLNDEGPLVSQFHDGSAVLNAWNNKSNSKSN